ncbi:hypothetical protein HMPREF1861_01687 [Corynebacterium kroppenstedtii]|nr:hypothetical protein HMPREF1861_01687 [Corynebacterium kroppenstedtii]
MCSSCGVWFVWWGSCAKEMKKGGWFSWSGCNANRRRSIKRVVVLGAVSPLRTRVVVESRSIARVHVGSVHMSTD